MPTVPRPPLVSLRAAFLLTLVASCSRAQPFTVGTLTGGGGGDFGPLVTVLDLSSPVKFKAGLLRSATFVWSNAPCPASAKITFFKLYEAFRMYNFYPFAERGPFFVHRATETVTLDPPVSISNVDYIFIGISSVTPCGGPVKAAVGPAIVSPGDFTGPFFCGPIGFCGEEGFSALVQASELSAPGPSRPKPRVIQFRH